MVLGYFCHIGLILKGEVGPVQLSINGKEEESSLAIGLVLLLPLGSHCPGTGSFGTLERDEGATRGWWGSFLPIGRPKEVSAARSMAFLAYFRFSSLISCLCWDSEVCRVSGC